MTEALPEPVRGITGSCMGHLLNWYAGWSLLLAAFATGAVIGLGFAREEFMGGYNSWRRRLTRLGHIALAALGMLNMIFGLAALPVAGTNPAFLVNREA